MNFTVEALNISRISKSAKNDFCQELLTPVKFMPRVIHFPPFKRKSKIFIQFCGSSKKKAEDFLLRSFLPTWIGDPSNLIWIGPKMKLDASHVKKRKKRENPHFHFSLPTQKPSGENEDGIFGREETFHCQFPPWRARSKILKKCI